MYGLYWEIYYKLCNPWCIGLLVVLTLVGSLITYWLFSTPPLYVKYNKSKLKAVIDLPLGRYRSKLNGDTYILQELILTKDENKPLCAYIDEYGTELRYMLYIDFCTFFTFIRF